MRRFSAGELDALMAPVALARARAVAPFVLLAIVLSLALSEPTGVPLAAPVLVWNLVAFAGFGTFAWVLHQRRLDESRGHMALAVVWWVPVCGTFASQIATASPVLSHLFAIEIVTAAVMLHARWMVGSMIAAWALWIPLVVLSGGDLAAGAPFVFAGSVIAVLFHRLFRTQMLEASTQRLVAAEASVELARQLEELRRSENERAQLQEQLVHAQRMEAVGTLAAGLAHDMNNILGSIATFADLVRDQVATPALRTDIERIASQAHRGAELTKALVAFSRRGQYRKRVVEADAVVRDVVPLLVRTLPKTVEITCELDAPGARLEGDPSQLGQVLVNLAVNATDAMQGQGRIAIRTRLAGDRVHIEVTDNGCGMDEATRLRVFEPFFTTKPIGKGTGLGLSTAWGIVTGHDGTVSVRSAPGQGATFLIELPTTTRRPTVRHVEKLGTRPPPVSRSTALVVDDEVLVRQGARRLLERAGYDVLEAGDGAEALRVFAMEPQRISIVLLDMSMPVMGGAACFDRLRTMSDVPVLVTTGYTNDAEAQTLLERGASLLEKPYASADLVREVQRLIAAHPRVTARSVA